MTPATGFSGRDLASLPVNVLLVGQQVSLVQRRGRYTPESMRHPGKMRPELARQLIEAYSQPGDWILDPMSGIGTTGVEAMHLDRRYVGIELEPRFVAWQRENLALAREQGAIGEGVVFQGDARALGAGSEAVSFRGPLRQPIAAIITSPPYGDRLKPRDTAPSRVMRDLIAAGRMRADVIPEGYGGSRDNLGNLPDEEYLEAMRQVYAGCLSVLKPGGILAVVIRPSRDRQRLRPLHYQTAMICCELGFEWIDEVIAVLSRVDTNDQAKPRLFSQALFLKRLATAHLREQGHPVTLEQVEYVLVFQKPSAGATAVSKHKSGRQTALAGAPSGKWRTMLPFGVSVAKVNA
jgi:DNA modification methylase